MADKNKDNKGKKITKDMNFAEALEKYPETGDMFLEEGMHCVGCPMSRMETIEEGCEGHNLDPDKIVEKKNK